MVGCGSRPPRDGEAPRQTALGTLLGSPSVRVREPAVAVAGLVTLQEGEQFKRIQAATNQVAQDAYRPATERVAAIHLLHFAPFSQLTEVAEELLDARQPLDIQLDAVDPNR